MKSNQLRFLLSVVALATPLQAADSFYSLNVSVSSGESPAEVVKALKAPLLELRDEILRAISLRADE